jgi:hypothetical protein
MQSTINTIAMQTLSRIDDARKLRARCGLEDDKMRVSIIECRGNTAVDATVKSGSNLYEVHLNEKISSCSCSDYGMRRTTCKHIAAVCMFLLGTTTPEAKPAPFALGDIVQLRGIPSRSGKVICVSNCTISVLWPPQGLRPQSASAHHQVALELASYPNEQKQAA